MSSGMKSLPTDTALAVVEILREELSRQGMNQTYLASVAGISQGQVSKILAGVRPMTLTEFMRMCTGLGLRAADVVEQAMTRAHTFEKGKP